MKKSAYVLSGVLIGAVLSTTTVAMADQVKSMIGKKVAGEYTVNVNGKLLTDKAIVVDNKAHVPLRSVNDSLGGSLNIDGRTIIIKTEIPKDTAIPVSNNKYLGKSKTEIEATLKILKEDVLQEALDARDRVTAEINRLKLAETPEMIPFWEEQLVEHNKSIVGIQADIAEAEAALAAVK
ncbi:2,' 3'-cyclic nucleotide 2'-phosphodiesterase [Paenibacillus sp. JSM ZJ436]|uniref:2,' 3'-cyclic nucleotide 2'-phosphodiesterase n=1 Tax=Paenibacillus sp. JSM ZJ436 TaxID=3376190 RepID=UPI00379542DC